MSSAPTGPARRRMPGLTEPTMESALSLAPLPTPAHAADVAESIVTCLERLGVEYVFGIPGGAIEPMYDALARSERRGGPRAIVTRHEAGAAYMADGYARESGRLGVCIATSGPGATNLITGVACAHDNRVPLLVITGQPPLHSFGRGALQESSCTGIDTIAMLRHCTHLSSLVSHADQLQPKLFNALMASLRAPQGATHLSIPVDLLRAPATLSLDAQRIATLLTQPSALVDPRAVDGLQAALAAARRPVFVIGEGCGEAIAPLMRLVQRTGAEFITTPDAKGYINPHHPRFRGVIGFGGHASASALLATVPDLVVAFGTSFGELASAGWSSALLCERLIHVDTSDEHLSRTPMARLHVRGRVASVCEQLVARLPDEATGATVLPFRDARDALLDDAAAFHSDAVPIKPQRLMKALTEHCPPHTRFVADTGNSMVWAVHCLPPHERRAHSARVATDQRSPRGSWLRVTMDFAPMGWAIGSAVGIASAQPGVPVVCLTGDGSYLMSGQEITVAAELHLPVIYVVLNDGALGMVRHGQRLAGAERIGTELPRVDFALVARAMGIAGHVIHSADDLAALDWPALLSRKGPTLLDVRIDGAECPPMRMRLRTLGTAQ